MPELYFLYFIIKFKSSESRTYTIITIIRIILYLNYSTSNNCVHCFFLQCPACSVHPVLPPVRCAAPPSRRTCAPICRKPTYVYIEQPKYIEHQTSVDVHRDASPGRPSPGAISHQTTKTHTHRVSLLDATSPKVKCVYLCQTFSA